MSIDDPGLYWADGIRVAVIPDNIWKMGGTRSFLLKLLAIHSNHQLPATLVMQSGQCDNELSNYCLKNNINIILVAPRSAFFHKPYCSLLYDFYVFIFVRIKVKPSIIFATIGTPRLLAGLFFFNTPLVYFLHTIPSYPSWKTVGMNYVMKVFSSIKKKVITVSEFSKKSINKNLFVDNKYIEVIYNSSKSKVRETPFNNMMDVVLTVGHVIWYKNIENWYLTAKEVISKKPSVIFIWLGEGADLERMRKKVISEGMSQNIIFPGYATDVNTYYEQATLYFQPSLIENHSIAILDAMSFALPCVASKVGGIPESINDGCSGFLLQAEDINGFAEKICYLLDNKKVAKSMGLNGKKIVEEKFSDRLQEKAILKTYADLTKFV